MLDAKLLSPPLLFIGFFTSHRSPLSERLEQAIETSIFNVNGDSLPGPLIIGTFEKRAPAPWNENAFYSLDYEWDVAGFKYCQRH